MIESLRISGFKAARQVELRDLGSINLFIGPNGSGKTTLLHSAFVFCIEADAGSLLSLVRPETDLTDAEGADRALSWLFTRDKAVAAKCVEVSGMVDGRPRSVSIKPVEVTPGLTKRADGDLDRAASPSTPLASVTRDLQAIRDSATLVVELATKYEGATRSGRLFVSHAHGVFAESPRQVARMPAALTRSLGHGPDFATLLDQAESAGTAARIEELLRTIDPGVRQLKIGVAADRSPVVRVHHERLGLCPVNVLGDGLSAALHFALILNAGTFRFVMFDEFDALLHVSVLRQLANFAKSMASDGIQLFLTTHRADTLGAFVDLVDEGWDGLRVFQTWIDDGEVHAQVFDGERLLSVWRDLALDIRVPS